LSNTVVEEHTMSRACLSGLFCLLFVLGFAVHAGAASFELTPGVGYLSGYTKFEIGDIPKEDDYVTPPRDPYFPVSELKFPLYSGIMTLDGKVTAGPFSIQGGVKKNFTHHPGMMRDYDWGQPYYDENGENGPGWYVNQNTDGTNVWYDLDVESKSRTRLDAKMWNAKASWRFYDWSYSYYETDWFTGTTAHHQGDLSLSLGIGYEKRRFDFETTLLRQWSPSGHDDIYAASGDGSITETYTVDYSIPYVELAVAQKTGKLDCGMNFGFSTLVHVSDDDVHLARTPGPIYNSGHLSGTALIFASHIQYDITPHIFVGLAGDYYQLRASGTQHQHINAGSADVDGSILVWGESDYSIEERVESKESCFTFNIGFRFGG
jgi:hypothetical protein